MTRRHFLTAILATAAITTIPALDLLEGDDDSPPPLSAGRRYQLNCTAWCRTKG